MAAEYQMVIEEVRMDRGGVEMRHLSLWQVDLLQLLQEVHALYILYLLYATR